MHLTYDPVVTGRVEEKNGFSSGRLLETAIAPISAMRRLKSEKEGLTSTGQR